MANDWQKQYAPKHHQEIGGFLGANPGDESRIGSALGIDPIQGWDGATTGDTGGIPGEIDWATPPAGDDYGYGLGFRPSDVGDQYSGMTDLDYQQAGGEFPTWESLGTPDVGLGDPMSLVQNQPVSGLLPALTGAGYQFQQDPYDTQMAGVPDYNVFYGDQQLPFGLRQLGAPPPVNGGTGGETGGENGGVIGGEAGGGTGGAIGGVGGGTNIVNPTLGGEGGGTSQPGAMTGFDQYPGSELLSMIGEIPIDSQSAPLYPGEFQDIFTTEVGGDPLSRKANLALENLIGTGGVVSTPFTAQAEQNLSEILDRGGETAPTEGEASIFRNLSDVVSGYGEAPPTTLEAEQQQRLNELIASGGELPQDDQRLAMQVEAARSPLDILRQSQLEQGQAAMAQRGLLGQGPEADYMERLEGQLAPMYTQAAQQIALEEGERADTRYRQALDQLNQQATTQRLSTDQRYAQARSLQTDMALDRAGRQDERLQNAIQTASNLTMEQSRNLVDSVNALSGVQQMRQDAAVEMLGKNMEWNKFLAEYGLERDKTMEALQQGRYEFILPLIQEYMKAAAMAAEGYVSGTSG